MPIRSNSSMLKHKKFYIFFYSLCCIYLYIYIYIIVHTFKYELVCLSLSLFFMWMMASFTNTPSLDCYKETQKFTTSTLPLSIGLGLFNIVLENLFEAANNIKLAPTTHWLRMCIWLVQIRCSCLLWPLMQLNSTCTYNMANPLFFMFVPGSNNLTNSKGASSNQSKGRAKWGAIP